MGAAVELSFWERNVSPAALLLQGEGPPVQPTVSLLDWCLVY